MNTLAVLKRLENAPKLCYSEILDCKILIDTGSGVNLIPSSLLSKFRERGFVIEEVETEHNLTFSEGTKVMAKKCWMITLPLSQECWYRGYYFENFEDYLVLGQPFILYNIIVYHRERILITDEQPFEFDVSVPLTLRKNKYYVKLTVNGRENEHYLDTGHSDAVTMPLTDMQYAISPIREKEDDLHFHGMKKHIIDHVEERGKVEIQGITRHGPIVYADYYNLPYWFNPAIIFADFMIDLKKQVIGFKNYEY